MIKKIQSQDYNSLFDTDNGFFVRWGETIDDDPQFAPAPELLDIEISTICSNNCSWCYKSNVSKGKIMNLETFKKLFHKFHTPILTQIAFGVGDLEANPDIWKILGHCRRFSVVPNITVKGRDIINYQAVKLAKLCGAVSVSNYGKDETYGAINLLTRLKERNPLAQVNIHQLLSRETLDKCYEVIDDSKKDWRLEKLNAIVFLWLKPKGRGENLRQISQEEFKKLVDYAFEKEVSIGFDSCSAPMFIEAIQDKENAKAIEMLCEPCESCLFSLYLNVDGIAFPCSFCEGEEGFEGINILEVEDFWKSEEIESFRKKSLDNGRKCQVFELGGE